MDNGKKSFKNTKVFKICVPIDNSDDGDNEPWLGANCLDDPCTIKKLAND